MTTGSNTSMNSDRAPRVFISYARSDGEKFAAELRQRLQDEHIPLWQDRVGMEVMTNMQNAGEFRSMYLAQGSVVPTLPAAGQKEAR